MSKTKINEAYIKAWSNKIEAHQEEVLFMVSKNDLGNISLHTINNLSQDKIKELFYLLAQAMEPNNIIIPIGKL